MSLTHFHYHTITLMLVSNPDNGLLQLLALQNSQKASSVQVEKQGQTWAAMAAKPSAASKVSTIYTIRYLCYVIVFVL